MEDTPDINGGDNAQTVAAGQLRALIERIERLEEDKQSIATEDGVEHWVPRSVCLDGDALAVGDDDLIVADWWLEKEGLL